MKRKASLAGAAVLILSFISPPAWAGGGLTGPAAVKTVPKTVAVSASGSYLVTMYADPLVASIPAKQLSGADAEVQGSELEATHDKVLADAGVSTADKVQDYTNALNGFSAIISHADAVRLAADPKVKLVVPDELRQATSMPSTGDGNSRVERNNLYDFLGLNGKGEAWGSGITGQGVVVGVIDTGIWPEHPSFADDGTYSAPEMPLDTTARSACDFGNTAANAHDAAFTCNNKLIGARQMLDSYRSLVGSESNEFDSARDDNGHGTHTASTAAGNADIRATIFNRFKGTISGIAPRAQIIAYKALGEQGGFTSDLVAAIDQAVADGVDVINYSVGGGAATVTSDTIAFLFAARAGVFSAVSAGNDGPDAATIGGPADVPWVTAVGANTQLRFYDGYIKLANGKTYRGSSVTHGTRNAEFIDAAAAGISPADPDLNPALCLSGSLNPARVAGKIVLCLRGGNGRIAKSQAVFDAGGIGMVLYNETDVDTLFSDNFFLPTVMVDHTPGTAIKAWLATPGSHRGRLAAGAIGRSPFASPTMAYFSSRGPNPTGADIIKPDLTAPGVQILAGQTPLNSPESGPQGQLFQAIAGTSMSSPIVAGLYALLKQAHPDWTAAEAKSALMTTADTRVKDNDRVTQAAPFAMGSGMAQPGKPGQRGSAFDPGLVFDAGFSDYLGYLCDEGPEAFNDPAATCAQLAAAGIPTTAPDLNYPSIGHAGVAGTTTVVRTVTSVADSTLTWTAHATAPAGYTVTVVPDTLRLAPGDSASYDVTISNDGTAPFGEWRFGSMVWTAGAGGSSYSNGYADGGYKVRSPIAVQGIQLEAPAALVGSGTQGDREFDVKFGYSGSYTASAHGLVAPLDTAGEISQDPDQTFPSPDDGAGVDRIPVRIDNVALARWSLVVPGDADLDLYLVDSAGTVIAQSTNGGTDETIELQAPADGDYTMIVHGWSVPVSPLAYTLQNWLVPESPGGGTLSITSGATTPAVVGTTHTVGVSWSGLSAGVTYLGAIAHADDSGVIGLTSITITG